MPVKKQSPVTITEISEDIRKEKVPVYIVGPDDTPDAVVEEIVTEQEGDDIVVDPDGYAYKHPTLTPEDCRRHRFWVCIRFNAGPGQLIERDWDWFDELMHLNDHRDMIKRWIKGEMEDKTGAKQGVWDLVAFDCKTEGNQPKFLWCHPLAGLRPGEESKKHIANTEKRFRVDVLQWSSEQFDGMIKKVAKKEATVAPSNRQLVRKGVPVKKAPAAKAAPAPAPVASKAAANKAARAKAAADSQAAPAKSPAKASIAQKAKAQRGVSGGTSLIDPPVKASASIAAKAKARRANNS